MYNFISILTIHVYNSMLNKEQQAICLNGQKGDKRYGKFKMEKADYERKSPEGRRGTHTSQDIHYPI